METQLCRLLAGHAAGLIDEGALLGFIERTDIDLARALKLAGLHGLSPTANWVFCRPGFEDWAPPGFGRQFAAEQARDIFFRSQIEKALGQLLDRLGELGVDAITLKGIWYATKLYRPSWLRGFSDIDLLLREEDWPAVLNVLKEMGCAPAREYSPDPAKLTKEHVGQHIGFRTRSGCVFDIALDLFKFGLRSPLHERIWSSTERSFLLGREVKVLSPEFEILNMCGHLHRHGWRRLIWFADLAAAIKKLEFDWSEIDYLARQGGLTTSVYYSIRYLNRQLGPVVQQDTLDSLAPGRRQRYYFSRRWPEKEVLGFRGESDGAVIFRDSMFHGDLIANLALTGQFRAKASYFSRKLFPTLQFLQSKAPDDRKERSYVKLYAWRTIDYLAGMKSVNRKDKLALSGSADGTGGDYKRGQSDR